MRASIIGLTTVLGAVVLAGAAAAQSGPSGGRAGNTLGSPIRAGAIPSVTDASFKQGLTNVATSHRVDEIDLAQRVAVLVDAGQCKEASALALAEGNKIMAAKVPQLCHPAKH